MKRIWAILTRSETELLELVLALITLAFGVVSAHQYSKIGNNSELFKVMEPIASLETWAYVYTAIGGLRLYGLGAGSVVSRILCAFLAVVLWCGILGHFMYDLIVRHVVSGGLAVFLGLSLANAWIVLRLVQVLHENGSAPTRGNDIFGTGRGTGNRTRGDLRSNSN